MTGILYGIGVGPGDPELLTLKAARLIAACPVVAYPMANGRSSIARHIAETHLATGTIERPYSLPMAVDPTAAQAAYDNLAATLSADLSAGRDTAVLCEGDPLLYGSFSEIMHRLADRFPVEVVPGIASPQAAAAALPMATAQRNASWSVLPATLSDWRLEARLAVADAAAIVKLGRHFARVRALLEHLRLTSFSYYCERVGQSGERLIPLGEVGTHSAPYFSLVLIQKSGQ